MIGDINTKEDGLNKMVKITRYCILKKGHSGRYDKGINFKLKKQALAFKKHILGNSKQFFIRKKIIS